jgi:hypothetical protein
MNCSKIEGPTISLEKISMEIKLLIIILIVFATNQKTFTHPVDSNCFYIYNCCHKTANDCLEYCEPVIECNEVTTATTIEIFITVPGCGKEIRFL